MTIRFIDEVKVDVVLGAVAAGTSNQISQAVSMEGYDKVVFVAHFGTLTAGQVTSLQGGTATDVAGQTFTSLGASYLTTAMADADSGKVVILEMGRPVCTSSGLIGVTVNRATSNAVINGVIAYRFSTRKAPVTQGSAEVSQSLAVNN